MLVLFYFMLISFSFSGKQFTSYCQNDILSTTIWIEDQSFVTMSKKLYEKWSFNGMHFDALECDIDPRMVTRKERG